MLGLVPMWVWCLSFGWHVDTSLLQHGNQWWIGPLKMVALENLHQSLSGRCPRSPVKIHFRKLMPSERVTRVIPKARARWSHMSLSRQPILKLVWEVEHCVGVGQEMIYEGTFSIVDWLVQTFHSEAAVWNLCSWEANYGSLSAWAKKHAWCICWVGVQVSSLLDGLGNCISASMTKWVFPQEGSFCKDVPLQ